MKDLKYFLEKKKKCLIYLLLKRSHVAVDLYMSHKQLNISNFFSLYL